MTDRVDTQIRVMDLFAGPGGLGEGFSALEPCPGYRPFRIIASVEEGARRLPDPTAARFLPPADAGRRPARTGRLLRLRAGWRESPVEPGSDYRTAWQQADQEVLEHTLANLKPVSVAGGHRPGSGQSKNAAGADRRPLPVKPIPRSAVPAMPARPATGRNRITATFFTGSIWICCAAIVRRHL